MLKRSFGPIANIVNSETNDVTGPPTSTTPARIFGYARVSTLGQDLSYQRQQLRRAGCVRIFEEKRSGKNPDRVQLHRLLKSLAPGDVVLATSTDRIARDPIDLLNILSTVKAAGANLCLVDEPFIDTASELSDLVLFIVGWAARWQRKRILENTAHGRALARERGVRFGRKPKLSQEQRVEILRHLGGGQSLEELAARFGVSRSTILRVRSPL